MDDDLAGRIPEPGQPVPDKAVPTDPVSAKAEAIEPTTADAPRDEWKWLNFIPAHAGSPSRAGSSGRYRCRRNIAILRSASVAVRARPPSQWASGTKPSGSAVTGSGSGAEKPRSPPTGRHQHKARVVEVFDLQSASSSVAPVIVPLPRQTLRVAVLISTPS